MNKLVDIVKFLFPTSLIGIIRILIQSRFLKFFYFREKILINNISKKHKQALKKIKNKNKIKVAFFVIHSSVWKYDKLYELMKNDDRFEPIIVICPYITFGTESMLNEMKVTYIYFKKNNYNIIKTYIKDTNEWLDVKKEINPDIVFFTNPHRITNNQYYITNFLDRLTCYVQYSFHITHLNNLQYDLLFHNLLWRAFYETPIHYELAKKYARNKAYNVVITGYPGTDIFLDNNYKPKDVWKIKDKQVKKIIWAPHHTIDDDKSYLSYSNFLKYYQDVLTIAEKYRNKIQIAFKPHPILKNKLYKHKDWGKEKTDLYYNEWKNLSNGQLEESGYIDLFITSDAMILDSASFITEYLYLNKPSLFTLKDENIVNRFNKFGKMAFEQLYHANDLTDINKFIDEILLENNDYMYINRKKFINEYLLPPNDNTASQNIFDNIKKSLFLK